MSSNPVSTSVGDRSPIIPQYSRDTGRVSPLRGAMIQTGAMFFDAYRELNARKMFWIVLILSGIVVISFAGVGIDQKGIYIFGMSLPLPFNTTFMPRADFYKMMFNSLGVSIWLSWAASILALISTAGIFPDTLTGGSIDLYLSKPISRLRLFFTKYAAALLFVTLQVGLFTVACFLVLGFRGGVWLWGLFLTIPIMVCFFSYLYAICVFFGVVTRSTLAALLLTLLCWFGIWIIHTTEASLLFFTLRSQQELAMYDRQIATLDKKITRLQTAAATTAPTTHSTTEETTANPNESLISRWSKALARQQEKQKGPAVALSDAQRELRELQQKKSEYHNPFVFWHTSAMAVKTALPKTTETIEVLNRGLAKYADMGNASGSDEDEANASSASSSSSRHRFDGSPEEQELSRRAQKQIVQELHHRSLAWVIGTSLGFEAVVLGLAALIFVRRDF